MNAFPSTTDGYFNNPRPNRRCGEPPLSPPDDPREQAIDAREHDLLRDWLDDPRAWSEQSAEWMDYNPKYRNDPRALPFWQLVMSGKDDAEVGRLLREYTEAQIKSTVRQMAVDQVDEERDEAERARGEDRAFAREAWS